MRKIKDECRYCMSPVDLEVVIRSCVFDQQYILDYTSSDPLYKILLGKNDIEALDRIISTL